MGAPSDIAELTEILHREPDAGYQVVGACAPTGIPVEPAELPVPILGGVAETRRACEDTGADTVLVARGGYSSSADLRRIAWDLEGSDIELNVVPSLTDVAGPRIHMRPVAGLPLLHGEGPQADEAGGMAKRAFDVVGALLGLLAISPLLVVVAILIKLEDRGPILFRQRRVGFEGEEFDCLKLRSMHVDAEAAEARLREQADHGGALFKLQQDPRTTRVGRVIRVK